MIKELYNNTPVYAVRDVYGNISETKTAIKLTILTSQGKNSYKKIFGKQTGVVNLASRNWVWKREFKGYTYYILCSKEGTAYEISMSYMGYIRNKKAIEVTKQFLNSVYKQLRTLPEVKEEIKKMNKIYKRR